VDESHLREYINLEKAFEPARHAKRREKTEGSQGLISHRPGERASTIHSVVFRVSRGISNAGFRIKEPAAKVTSGFEKSDTGMPSYNGAITDAQIEALVL